MEYLEFRVEYFTDSQTKTCFFFYLFLILRAQSFGIFFMMERQDIKAGRGFWQYWLVNITFNTQDLVRSTVHILDPLMQLCQVWCKLIVKTMGSHCNAQRAIGKWRFLRSIFVFPRETDDLTFDISNVFIIPIYYQLPVCTCPGFSICLIKIMLYILINRRSFYEDNCFLLWDVDIDILKATI